MNTQSLRLLWQAVSRLSPENVTGMTYEELMSNLLHQLSQRQPLSPEDWVDARAYLSQKEPLIRELICE